MGNKSKRHGVRQTGRWLKGVGRNPKRRIEVPKWGGLRQPSVRHLVRLVWDSTSAGPFKRRPVSSASTPR